MCRGGRRVHLPRAGVAPFVARSAGRTRVAPAGAGHREFEGPGLARIRAMTDMFLEKFRALVPKYLEDEWQEEDGLPAEELDSALAEHQFTVPLVLREFY